MKELREVFSPEDRVAREKAARAAARVKAERAHKRAIRHARTGLRSQREASTIEALEDLTRQLHLAQARRSSSVFQRPIRLLHGSL